MSELKILHEKRLRLLEIQKEIVADGKKSDDGITKEAKEKFKRAEVDYKAITVEYDMLRGIEAKESDESFVIEKIQKEKQLNEVGFENEEEYKEAYSNAFKSYIQKGAGRMSEKDISLMENKFVTKGTSVQIGGTDSLGGYNVPEGFSNEIEVYLDEISEVRNFARILKTKSGNPIDWPDVDDTGVSGTLHSEGVGEAVSDLTFGNNTLNSYTLDSSIIKVSLELLADSAIPMETLVGEIFGNRLGRGVNPFYTTGTGSSQPQGVVVGANAAKATTSGTVTVTALITLKHAIDRQYRKSKKAAFMFNDSILLAAKLLTLGSSDDRALWVPSRVVGEPDTIDGTPYIINQDMDGLGDANKWAIFGDFSKFIIRDIGGFQMFRFEEKYMDALSKGFIAWMRTDSRVINTDAFTYIYDPAT